MKPSLRSFSQLRLPVFFVLALLSVASPATAQQQQLSEALFRNPPKTARPLVWWHWMNGNITREGIRLDLEWMKRIGLSGFQQFNAADETPTLVDKPLVYMTPEWKSTYLYAIQTANRLGLSASIASSAGWSETGGPWVTGHDAMKKMVWGEIHIIGGHGSVGLLEAPPHDTGPFQDFHSAAPPRATFYADSAVLAFPTPPSDMVRTEAQFTVSSGSLDVAALSDGRVGPIAATIPYSPSSHSAWIQVNYTQPTPIQAVTLAAPGETISIFGTTTPPTETLEFSEDGVHFTKICDLPRSNVLQRTNSFPPVTAKYFRITFLAPVPVSKTSGPVEISELVFHTGARINRVEEKAGYATSPNYYAVDTPEVKPQDAVPVSKVLDVTRYLHADGTLAWTPPPGEWTILRIGYSLLGKGNGPAPPAATGLEVDKLNAASVRRYMTQYLTSYQSILGSALMGSAGLQGVVNDSIESGPQNWTSTILTEFQRRRGYSPLPWLPTLVGTVVGSAQESDRFLWDFRETLDEMFAENHYGTIAAVLHANGLQSYGEALERNRPNLGDDMDMRRYTDVPMGAMWTFPAGQQPPPGYVVDIRGAASVAHIYGKTFVGAESMTSSGPAWGFAPSDLKPIADLEFALGVNRIMIHESAHQPLLGKVPGLSLGPFGQWFNRNETWAEQAKPWIDYLSRSSYMLQLGHACADIAYFYGQEGPITGLYSWNKKLSFPTHYGFDFVNAHVLTSVLIVQDHKLVTPRGASYRVLYLGGRSQRITLPVLLRLRELIKAGAVVIGEKPTSSPSLADSQQEFQEVVDDMWGSGQKPVGVRHLGRGELWQGLAPEEVLREMRVPPDFTSVDNGDQMVLQFTHRRLTDADIYFVSNPRGESEHSSVTVRVSGKVPELWHPETGDIDPISYDAEDGVTHLVMHLEPHGSAFLVFHKKTTQDRLVLPDVQEKTVATLPDKWLVSFEPNRGAPETCEFIHLHSWSGDHNPGIRYFSGHASYTQSLSVPDSWFRPHQRLYLDLGKVREIAVVTVNGKTLGEVWHSPFRVDVTSALHPGLNTIIVKVTNLWVNRLIGDAQPNATKKYTFTTQHPYKADSPLRESGLLGPVRIVAVELPRNAS